MHAVTERDRARFPGMTDAQISDIFAAQDRRREVERARPLIAATDVFLAKIARYLGYDALRDFLRGGTDEMDAQDFASVVNAAEWLETRHETRRDAVVQGFAAEPQTRQGAAARRQLAKRLRENDNVFREDF